MSNHTELRTGFEALDEERARFATMLHDGVAQSLTALAFSTRLLWDDLRATESRGTAEMRNIVAEVEACAQQVRSISRMLAPTMLLRAGIVAAIEEYARCLSARHRARLSLPAGQPRVLLPDPAASQCFGIACELIRIALQGSGNPVVVEVRLEGREVRLSVDANCGEVFPPAGAFPAELMERARRLDARFHISPRRDRVSVAFVLADGEIAARDRVPAERVGALNAQEVEVLRLLGHGASTRDIAAAINRSPKTVELHRANLRRRLGLATSNQLITFASRWLAELQRNPR